MRKEKRSLFCWRRLCLGMSQKQLGDLLGMSQTAISKIEGGDFSQASVLKVRRLAIFLGIPEKTKKQK